MGSGHAVASDPFADTRVSVAKFVDCDFFSKDRCTEKNPWPVGGDDRGHTAAVDATATGCGDHRDRLWRSPAGLARICLARFKSVASDLFDWARLHHRDAWGD